MVSGDGAVTPVLPSLSVTERGFVLGVAAAGGGDAVLVGRGAARCRQALQELAAAAPATRAAWLAALASEIGAPVPAGIERVHPAWIRGALEGESSFVVRAVALATPAAVRAVAEELLVARGEKARGPGDATRPEMAAALCRAVLARFAPIATGVGALTPAIRELAGLTFDGLVGAIDRRGAITLGHSLSGAPAALVAKAAAGVGEPLGGVVVEAARAQVAPGTRALSRVWAAGATSDAAPLGAVRAIGLRALAADIAREKASPDARNLLALRLPPPLGEALLALLSREPAADQEDG